MFKCLCWHADYPEALEIRYIEGDEERIKEEFYGNKYHIEEIPENSVVLDLGAYIGIFSLHVAKMRGCNVYAYEPFPDTFKLLVKNVELNKLESQIKCFKQAVAGKSEIRKIYTMTRECTQMVPCVTLKQIFEENSIENVGCLKMDIKEAEKEVFNEESKPYFSRVEYLAMEWHNYDGQKYSEYMKDLGFSVFLTGIGEGKGTYDPSFKRGTLYAWRN